MPVGCRVKEIQIVNEHQKLYEDEVQTYDVWLTRGIVFVLEDGLEIALEKNVWFKVNYAKFQYVPAKIK